MTTTELLKALDEAGLFLWADGETLLVIGVAKPGTDPGLVDAIQAHRSALLRELRAGPICVVCRKPITGERTGPAARSALRMDGAGRGGAKAAGCRW